MQALAKFLFIIPFFFCCCGGEKKVDHLKMEESFKKAFLSAFQEKNSKKCMELVAWHEETPPFLRIFLKQSFEKDFKQTIKTIHIAPVIGNEMSEIKIRGNRYVPSLKPERKCTITYVNKEIPETNYFLGIQGGRYWIIAPKKKTDLAP